MADLTTNNAATSTGFSFTGLMTSFFDGLMRMSENSPKAKQIAKLNTYTDDQLVAMGTTRQNEVLRILGSAAYV